MSDKRLYPTDALRECKTALSWFMRAVRALHAVTEDSGLTALGIDASWLMGHEAERLIGTTLDHAEFLIPLLDEQQIADAEQNARAFLSALRRARLAAKLSNTTGRTPEEAAAFAAKARELGR